MSNYIVAPGCIAEPGVGNMRPCACGACQARMAGLGEVTVTIPTWLWLLGAAGGGLWWWSKKRRKSR